MSKEQNQPSPEVYQALKEAIKRDDAEMLKALIDDHKFDINYQDSSGNSLLHAAILRNSPKIAEFLISNGADTENIVNNDGVTVRKLATSLGRNDLLEEMSNYQKRDQLVLDALNVNTSEMSRQEEFWHSTNTNALLEKYYTDINERDSEGNTLLHKAIKQGRISAAAQLISWGADIEIRNNEGKTPEMLTNELPKSMGFEKMEIMRHIEYANEEIVKENNPAVQANTRANLRNKEIGSTIPDHDVRFERKGGKVVFEKKLDSDGNVKKGLDGKADVKPKINYTNIARINEAWANENAQYPDEPRDNTKVKFSFPTAAPQSDQERVSVEPEISSNVKPLNTSRSFFKAPLSFIKNASTRFSNTVISFVAPKKATIPPVVDKPIVDPHNVNDSFVSNANVQASANVQAAQILPQTKVEAKKMEQHFEIEQTTSATSVAPKVILKKSKSVGIQIE